LFQLAQNYLHQGHNKILKAFKASLDINFLEVMGETCK